MDKSVVDRATATKELLEAKLRSRKAEAADRRERRMALNRMLADPALDAAAKARLTAEFEMRERDLLREARKRYSPADFDPLVVIGRGAFGEVREVLSGAPCLLAVVAGVGVVVGRPRHRAHAPHVARAGQAGAREGGRPHLRHEVHAQGRHDFEEPGVARARRARRAGDGGEPVDREPALLLSGWWRAQARTHAQAHAHTYTSACS